MMLLTGAARPRAGVRLVLHAAKQRYSTTGPWRPNATRSNQTANRADPLEPPHDTATETAAAVCAFMRRVPAAEL